MKTDPYWNDVIEPGDRASQLAKDIGFASHNNCPALRVVPHEPGNFRGPVGWLWNDDVLMAMAKAVYSSPWTIMEQVENDGAGGKPQFFTLMGTRKAFRQLGWEVIVMTADDFSRSGRLPCIMVNEQNVKRISEKNFPLVRAAFEGYGRALKKARLVNLTGEIAVMKHSVTAFCDQDNEEQLILNWGGTCIGLAHRDLLLHPDRIKPGMVIVGFWEPSYRCNGGTFFTNVLLERFGPEIDKIRRDPKAKNFLRLLTVPSLYYGNTVTRLCGWNPDGSVNEPLARIAGIAHITGGGVWGKFGEILPDGVGAHLDKMPRPAEVLTLGQTFSLGTKFELSDWQAYRTLHGGCGMLLICETERDAKTVIGEAKLDGIQAKIVGHTIASPAREVVIESKFMLKKQLSSLHPE